VAVSRYFAQAANGVYERGSIFYRSGDFCLGGGGGGAETLRVRGGGVRWGCGIVVVVVVVKDSVTEGKGERWETERRGGR